MDQDQAGYLFEKALKCRRLAWSLSDEQAQHMLNDVAAAYEAEAGRLNERLKMKKRMRLRRRAAIRSRSLGWCSATGAATGFSFHP